MSENRRHERPHYWRREGFVVHRLGPTETEGFNQLVARTGVQRPTVSEAIEVFDVAVKECYLVLLHQVNRHSPEARRVGQLVKLSEQRVAPHRARELWLRTPAYYRKRENSGTKPTDPHDASLTMDATPFMLHELAPKISPIPTGSLNATMRLSSPQEPWVYCTSIPPTSEAERKKLMASFPWYDAMTVIRDRSSFAIQLGIDFAISVQESAHVELGAIEILARWQSRDCVSFREGGHPITKVICVYHGPVVYEDESGVLESMKDFINPSLAVRAWFTKKRRFCGEREYRFAVSTLGKPRKDTFELGISDELRSLTAHARPTRRASFADRWRDWRPAGQTTVPHQR